MKERIRSQSLRPRITTSQDAAAIIKTGMNVAVGGFTPSGYPKAVPAELVKRKGAGDDLQINLISGANVGPEIDEDMATAGLIARRIPLQGTPAMARLINQGELHFVEIPLHKMSRVVRNGLLGKIDVAIVEALAITEEGYLVPNSSVGMDPVFVQEAEAVIVEINDTQPAELEGIHDIYIPASPPHRKPIPLTYTNQRIGEPFIRINPDKIKSIVTSNLPDRAATFGGDDETIRKIGHNLLNFLEIEIASRRLPGLLPLQSGLGNMANGIVRTLGEASFDNLEFYCGVLQEANIELIAQGRVRAASGAAFTPSPKALQLIRDNPDEFKKIMVLRPADITNNAEIIERLGLISLNNAIEVDMYGNANTTHIMGSRVVNGIGGGGAFSQNAYLSIMLLPSVTQGGNISTIVPMVSHNGINEHDMDVIITEHGVADLRGKDPLERARCIISACADPVYKEQLDQYLRSCIRQSGGHQPQLLKDAFSWHLRLKETGTMKES